MKLSFGENRCFLIPINSNETPLNTDGIDIWLKYLRRQPKNDVTLDPGSAPKTPQDFVGVTSMPTTVQMSTLETPPPGIQSEEIVDHPLSPSQEQATEAIVRLNLIC